MESIEWSDGSVVLAANSQPPEQAICHICHDYREVSEAIRSETICDSSSLGVAAGMGIALGAWRSLAETVEEFDGEFETICLAMIAARPGGQNIVPVVRRLRSTYHKYRLRGILVVRIALMVEALIIQAEDSATGRNDPCMFDIGARHPAGHVSPM